MAAIGLIVHEDRPAAAKSARDLSKWLTSSGHQVRMPPEEAEATGCENLAVEHKGFADGLDTLVTLGGDGSILRAIKLVGTTQVPILGVDFGRLGYLSEVQPGKARAAIERVLKGDFKVEDRLLLDITHQPCHTTHHTKERTVDSSTTCRTDIEESPQTSQTSPSINRYLALNEAFIERGPSSNTIFLTVHVDDDLFTTYRADGLIVATPTGSTAYAFSAGGPIIDPSHQALLLTPVSPHMLFNRSLVVPSSTHLQIMVTCNRPAVLSIDGRRVAKIDVGDTVKCSKSPHSVSFIKFGKRPFHQVLKAKFGLADYHVDDSQPNYSAYSNPSDI